MKPAKDRVAHSDDHDLRKTALHGSTDIAGMLTPAEAAAILHVEPRTLEGWRRHRTGPRYFRDSSDRNRDRFRRAGRGRTARTMEDRALPALRNAEHHAGTGDADAAARTDSAEDVFVTAAPCASRAAATRECIRWQTGPAAWDDRGR
jgi:hypothetical protein